MTEREEQMQESTSAPDDVIESVRELIEMMNKGGISELDLSAGDVSVRLRSQAASLAAQPIMAMPPQMMSAPMAGYPQAMFAAESSSTSVTTVSNEAATPAVDGHVVTSPMIGTYYSASAPGEPAYVQIGDEVESGQVIGIIEAMKIMNEITADKGGVVVEIMVENAQAVEYGSPLVRISTSAQLD